MWIGVLWAGLRVAMWITHVGGKFRHGLLEKSPTKETVTKRRRGESIVFIRCSNPKHLLGQNFPSKGKLGGFSLRGKIFPLRNNFPLKTVFFFFFGMHCFPRK